MLPKKYKTILCDPPWCYRNKKTGGSHKSGAAQKYPVLFLEDIMALPIQQMADPACCVLLLWATVPLLAEAFGVMDAWGFNYKTCIFWRKIMSQGMGFWFRGQVEVCMLGISGKVKAWRCQKKNIIESKIRRHSQKPEELFQLIEPYIKSPRIELFATERREGWDAMGYDIDHKDIRTVMAERGYIA